MKIVKLHPLAEEEMIQAAGFYESQQSGLGKRFLISVQDGMNRMALNPRLYPIIYLDVRRCLVKTFPFSILFREKRDKLVVMAVMHMHRDPDYWKTR